MAKESSFSGQNSGFLAIDGQLSPPYCFVSQTSCYQWLQIDLIWLYRVDVVQIVEKFTTNEFNVQLMASSMKTNASCKNMTSQLNNINVTFQCPNATEHASSSSYVPPTKGGYPLCARYPGVVPVASRVTLQCNANLPAYRYIIVHQAFGAGNGYLAVCELEAYEPQMKFPNKR
ncbi:hypothetical protein HELRODRAFT_179256 [Helobdella robusta]|uniref:Fucolectin tachylectin-4 pentraxin-1 domain-containing protein n=1 Tax=Helobdella robusta TaxID=6412 RepID=T1FEF8_HELRO|nr:hypothetical protein HELRODRAFT_179256 [Helobdella robusta]ESN95486.1 hypothetical protein HELRODRAFT_179256 [Helobdella robusta]